MLFTTLLLALTPALAAAAPGLELQKRIVGIESCNATNPGFVNGTLSAASGSATDKGFSLDSSGHLSFASCGADALSISFAPCVPNFGRFGSDTSGPIEGHLIIGPGNASCLAVDFGPGPDLKLPVSLTTMDCPASDDSGQVFTSFVKFPNGTIFWVGITQADGSLAEQIGDCKSGTYGYVPNAKGVPADGHVLLDCAGPGRGLGFAVNDVKAVDSCGGPVSTQTNSSTLPPLPIIVNGTVVTPGAPSSTGGAGGTPTTGAGGAPTGGAGSGGAGGAGAGGEPGGAQPTGAAPAAAAGSGAAPPTAAGSSGVGASPAIPTITLATTPQGTGSAGSTGTPSGFSPGSASAVRAPLASGALAVVVALVLFSL